MNSTRPDQIINAVCNHFGVDRQELEIRKDHQSAYMRDICFYLIKKETYLSHKMIGGTLKRGECVSRAGLVKTENLLSIKDRRILADLSKINLLLGTFTT